MAITLQNLRSPHGSRHRVKRVGRGNASGHGTTATRGTKGQRARQGGRKGLTQLGIKHFVSHLPKVRGFTTLRIRPEVITIQDLAKFTTDAVIDRKVLHAAGLLSKALIPVKLIGSGPLTRKLTIRVQAASAGARASVEKAGGKLEIVPLREEKIKPQ